MVPEPRLSASLSGKRNCTAMGRK